MTIREKKLFQALVGFKIRHPIFCVVTCKCLHTPPPFHPSPSFVQAFLRVLTAAPACGVALAALGALQSAAGDVEGGLRNLRAAADKWGSQPIPGE